LFFEIQDGWFSDVNINQIASSVNNSYVWGMNIAELLVYDEFLSAPEITVLTEHLGDKYGIAVQSGGTYVEPLAPTTDGAVDLSVDADLNWLPGTTDWAVDVYFDLNETDVTNGNASVKIASSEIIPSHTIDLNSRGFDPMANSTTYFWRVDLLEPNSPAPIIHQGPVWSFVTEPDLPYVTTDPISQTVNTGDPVTLSITANYATGYQWHLNGSPVAGATSTTYSIASLGIANEGVYTCEVSNVSGSGTSAPAVVVSKRLMGWWKLDNNLTDSVALAEAGALAHDGSISVSSFGTGADGLANHACVLDGSDFITIANSSDYFGFYPNGLTVSAWVNTAQADYGALVSNSNSDNSAGFYLEHESDNWLISGLRGIDGQWYWAQPDSIYNTWQLVTLTLDGDTKTVKQYVNGELEIEAAYTVDLPVSTVDLIFGAESPGAYLLDGSLDDVRIYSYPLDNVAVAQLYYDMTGTPACAGYPNYDLTGPASVPDCRVDLYDFAVVAAEWLECNLVPTCIP
jgi:hypothetical protein